MLSGDDTSPDQVFAAINGLIASAGDAKMDVGSYQGNGSSSFTISSSGKPYLCVIMGNPLTESIAGGSVTYQGILIATRMTDVFAVRKVVLFDIRKSTGENNFTFSNGSIFNYSGKTYYYVIFSK